MILLTCILTPFYLAFPDCYGSGMNSFDHVMNIGFLIDIFINFASAYHNANYKVIDDRKVSIFAANSTENCQKLFNGVVLR